MALASRNIQSSRTCSSVAGCRRGVAPFRPVRKVAQSVRADAAAEAPKAVEKSGPNFKALRDINQIMQTLPHRCGCVNNRCSACSTGMQALPGGKRAPSASLEVGRYRRMLHAYIQLYAMRRHVCLASTLNASRGTPSPQGLAPAHLPALTALHASGDVLPNPCVHSPFLQHFLAPTCYVVTRPCQAALRTPLSPPAPAPATPLVLPPRYPFLLVDRVVEWEKEKYAVGYKCVTINDNFFPGHFPERPIMPGGSQDPPLQGRKCLATFLRSCRRCRMHGCMGGPETRDLEPRTAR